MEGICLETPASAASQEADPDEQILDVHANAHRNCRI